MTAALTTNQIASALRLRVLRLTPEDIGIDSASECPPVWGVMIETAHPDAVASLVALADGSVSFYVSDGNGCVGCGSNREVRWTASDLLQVAEKMLPRAAVSDDFSLPPEGYVRCYLLTRNGLYLLQVKLEDINRADASVGVVYFAAQRVIGAIERVGAGQSLAQEMKLAMVALASGATCDASSKPLSPSSPLSVKDETQSNPGFDSPQGVAQCLSVGNVVLRLRT